MHEASVLNSLMRRIETLARAEGATRVSAVTVWLGALSHMSPAHFREHFSISAAGTLAAGARLTIHQSHDLTDPQAQSILLESIDVDE